jgi:hypothetical protein
MNDFYGSTIKVGSKVVFRAGSTLKFGIVLSIRERMTGTYVADWAGRNGWRYEQALIDVFEVEDIKTKIVSTLSSSSSILVLES